MIVNWNSVVQVLALNCVDESNEEICRNYSVMAYPTVRLFWTNVTSQDDTGEHIYNLQQTPEFLRDELVNFIVKNLKINLAPKSWPNLNKLNVSNQQDLKQHLDRTNLAVESNKIPIVGLVEKNDSFVGQKVSFILKLILI